MQRVMMSVSVADLTKTCQDALRGQSPSSVRSEAWAIVHAMVRQEKAFRWVRLSPFETDWVGQMSQGLTTFSSTLVVRDSDELWGLLQSAPLPCRPVCTEEILGRVARDIESKRRSVGDYREAVRVAGWTGLLGWRLLNWPAGNRIDRIESELLRYMESHLLAVIASLGAPVPASLLATFSEEARLRLFEQAATSLYRDLAIELIKSSYLCADRRRASWWHRWRLAGPRPDVGESAVVKRLRQQFEISNAEVASGTGFGGLQ